MLRFTGGLELPATGAKNPDRWLCTLTVFRRLVTKLSAKGRAQN